LLIIRRSKITKKLKSLLRLSRRGDRGFTLLEILVVVAILGTLAAIVIPSILNLMSAGREEAMQTEHYNVQIAVLAMMVDAEVSELDSAHSSVNTETDVGNVKCGSGAHSLRDYLYGGEYPLMQDYDITLKGEVTIAD
jgi:prepilin-type N-terminal cleavage/methylation domain-containing protein